MLRHPESVNCPACRSPDYITVHSDGSSVFELRLVNLRQCAECGTHYLPPASRWISLLAVLLGAVAVVVGGYFGTVIPDYFTEEEHAAQTGIRIVLYLFAAVGFGFVMKGIARLATRRIPEPAEPVPSNEDVEDSESK
ncbi:MAG: hypothetical protein WD070_00590 [Pirellulaceae bacterium]